jgi:hypothetical protein
LEFEAEGGTAPLLADALLADAPFADAPLADGRLADAADAPDPADAPDATVGQAIAAQSNALTRAAALFQIRSLRGFDCGWMDGVINLLRYRRTPRRRESLTSLIN